jgi:SAM-dependent methyltransferase
MRLSSRENPEVQRVGAQCACCGSEATTASHAVGEHRYVVCSGCGTARLASIDTIDAAALYDDGYFVRHDDRGGYLDYERDASLHLANARRRVRRCVAQLPEGGRRGAAIDVGCASGYTLDAYGAAGFSTIGVDISSWARDRCTERGHCAVPTLADAVSTVGQAEVVSFFQSLEHLGDPAGAVRTAAEVLVPGGVLLIETWDRGSLVARVLGRRWHQVNPPSVLHHFTGPGLRRMLGAEGFDVVAIDKTSKLVSLELVLGVLTQRSVHAARWLRPLRSSRLSSVPIPYRMGDLVTVVAVKRGTHPRPG